MYVSMCLWCPPGAPGSGSKAVSMCSPGIWTWPPPGWKAAGHRWPVAVANPEPPSWQPPRPPAWRQEEYLWQMDRKMLSWCWQLSQADKLQKCIPCFQCILFLIIRICSLVMSAELFGIVGEFENVWLFLMRGKDVSAQSAFEVLQEINDWCLTMNHTRGPHYWTVAVWSCFQRRCLEHGHSLIPRFHLQRVNCLNYSVTSSDNYCYRVRYAVTHSPPHGHATDIQPIAGTHTHIYIL